MKKKLIVITLIIILLIIGIITTIIELNDDFEEEVDIKNTIKYNIQGDDLLNKIHKKGYAIIGLATNEDEYEELLEKYSYFATTDGDGEEDLNFKKNNYYLLAFSDGGCMYELKPLSYEIENKEISFLIKETSVCGGCKESTTIYSIPVSKKVTEKYDVEVEFKTKKGDGCSDYPVVSKKPLLYLYPENKTNIKVEFTNPKNITTSYPKYDGSWNVVAYPNGDLYDVNNKYYYGLYWEEKDNSNVDFSEGFYVTKDNAINFLEEKLTTIGLNDKERNEFIIYWLPILERNGKSLVYFELTNELEESNRLIITPKPDSLLRVRMHIKKVDKKINIKKQTLTTFEREGFTAVEWGGTIH